MVRKFGPILINGDGEFVDSTIAALTLLQPYQDYEQTIETNISVINFFPNSRQGKHSGAEAIFKVDSKPVNVYSRETVVSSPYAYALLLAHEAYHHYLFERFMRLGNRKLWKWHRRYFPNRDEFRCQQFEVRVSKQLGFPEELHEWKEVSLAAIPHSQMPRKQIKIMNHLRRLSLKFGSAETDRF